MVFQAWNTQRQLSQTRRLPPTWVRESPKNTELIWSILPNFGGFHMYLFDSMITKPQALALVRFGSMKSFATSDVGIWWMRMDETLSDETPHHGCQSPPWSLDFYISSIHPDLNIHTSQIWEMWLAFQKIYTPSLQEPKQPIRNFCQKDSDI